MYNSKITEVLSIFFNPDNSLINSDILIISGEIIGCLIFFISVFLKTREALLLGRTIFIF